ncbi:PAS domain-containing protein [Ohtaekwangia koreensis]|uniref:histidine kinase n=1 Tax=Ohtaekwangia koreensis TaxID=688867 RepID=A0A1T5M5Q1_9BACT|nr:PAS domain-containing protein [Ohtaekwangia koreensis]SKC83561.1 PAS domain S-box-containing protein [Ohtaekwangia koreensis]
MSDQSVQKISSPLLYLADALPGVTYQITLLPHITISYVSKGVTTLLGVPPDELLFKPTAFYRQFLAPADKQIIDHKIEIAQHSHKLEKLQLQIIDIFEKPRIVDDWFVGVFNDDNELTAIEGYIAESKRTPTEWNLLNQLKAYRNAIDVNIISSITDTHGVITYANENFQRVSKYNQEELVGHNHSVVRSGYHSREFFKELWQTISSGKRWSGEILNRAKDGTLYWVDTVIIPIFNEERVITSYLSLRTLITDRKNAELQKDGYIRVLEDIAHIVAHDVRGPVCSIIGLTNLIQTYTNVPDTLRQPLDYLRLATNRLDDLTHKLSDKIYSTEMDLRAKDK